MKINRENHKYLTYFILILIAISTVLSYGISLFLKKNNLNIPFYIDLPIATTAIYSILFMWFDKKLWKLGIFKRLGIITAEDLNGKWIGHIKSSYDKFATEIPTELIIKQTGTTVKIQGKFNQSKSISVHEDFGISEIDQSTALFYFYRNVPNNDAESTMAIHEGSTKLIYNKETDTLDGSYFSGRDRNNYGTMTVKRQK